MVCLEQKKDDRMDEFAIKSPNLGELEVDLFCNTSATAEAYSEPPQHRCLEGCDVDADSFAENIEALAEKRSKQIFNE